MQVATVFFLKPLHMLHITRPASVIDCLAHIGIKHGALVAVADVLCEPLCCSKRAAGAPRAEEVTVSEQASVGRHGRPRRWRTFGGCDPRGDGGFSGARKT